MNIPLQAQEWLEKKLSDQNTKLITTSKEKLQGELIIQDYPNLEIIHLPENELISLEVVNCPALKYINVRDNQLTKLEITQVNTDGKNKIIEIIAGGNELTYLNLGNCSCLLKLIIPDNPSLTAIDFLSFKTVRHLNVINTAVELDEVEQLLRKEKEKMEQHIDGLSKALKVFKEVGQQKPLVLTETIQTPKQAEEAIKRLLKETELRWREYFESKDPKVAQKYPSLHLSCQTHEGKTRVKQVLIWIIGAQEGGDYRELVNKWNGGEKYNPKYNYDGSLGDLMEIVEAWEKSKFNNKINQK